MKKASSMSQKPATRKACGGAAIHGPGLSGAAAAGADPTIIQARARAHARHRGPIEGSAGFMTTFASGKYLRLPAVRKRFRDRQQRSMQYTLVQISRDRKHKSGPCPEISRHGPALLLDDNLGEAPLVPSRRTRHRRRHRPTSAATRTTGLLRSLHLLRRIDALAKRRG